MTLLTGSANAIKYVLFAFNFVFVLTGIILISIGVTVSTVYREYDPFLESKFFSIPTFLIVIGSFIFFIAFFGCCGAIKENYCMVLTFAGLLIFIFILELAAGISGYVLRNEAKELLSTSLKQTMSKYGSNTTDGFVVTKLWDTVQEEFHCCGIEKYTDWLEVKKSLPVSCCSQEYGALDKTYCRNDTASDNRRLYVVGCKHKFGDYIEEHAVSLGGAGIAIAVIQFIGIFFACYVAREIKIKYGGGVM